MTKTNVIRNVTNPVETPPPVPPEFSNYSLTRSAVRRTTLSPMGARELSLARFCRETLQVERALLRTLVERATERPFHPSYHLAPAGGAGNKASFATELARPEGRNETSVLVI